MARSYWEGGSIEVGMGLLSWPGLTGEGGSIEVGVGLLSWPGLTGKGAQ